MRFISGFSLERACHSAVSRFILSSIQIQFFLVPNVLDFAYCLAKNMERRSMSIPYSSIVQTTPGPKEIVTKLPPFLNAIS